MTARQRLMAKMVAALLTTTAAAANMTPAQGSKTSPPTYSEVIDKAFRFSDGIPTEFKNIEFRIAVRYLPSDGTHETQVVITKQRNGAVKAVRYTLKSGTPSILDQYTQALKMKSGATVDDIVRPLIVENQELASSDVLGKRLKEFLGLSMPTNLSPEVCMDGMTYDVWVDTPSNRIRASFSNSAYGDKTNSEPMIRWIRELYSVVALAPGEASRQEPVKK